MRRITRKLPIAMCKWREVAAEMARQQYMMGGAVRRMIHLQLSMAWEKWQYEAAEGKRQQALLDGVDSSTIRNHSEREATCCFHESTWPLKMSKCGLCLDQGLPTSALLNQKNK